MKALWTQEEASYHGEFVNFDRVWSYPKPLTVPHPPIILGSMSSKLGRQRVVDHCDGWLPIETLIDDWPAALTDLNERAEKAGGAPQTLFPSRSSASTPRTSNAWSATGIWGPSGLRYAFRPKAAR